MPALSRRNRFQENSAWPGWVDALSSLLMVVVFVLMVFMAAQFALSNALTGRDEALARLNRRIAELADLLALEKASSEDLRDNLAQLSTELQASLLARDELNQKLASAEQAVSTEQAQTEAGRNQITLLNQQIAALREQLNQLTALLDASEARTSEQEAQIADLGRRLNLALASRVEELARYRSEFFGRLREALGERSDIRIVGDRFVFQSEVLFPTASAELQEAGKAQLAELAQTLKEIAAKIPPDLNWILRVDGHTDRRPIRTAQYPTNWELSAARAVEVVRFLITQGIPPERLAAAGFGEYQPLEGGDTEDAYARNRRIELKFDQRSNPS